MVDKKKKLMKCIIKVDNLERRDKFISIVESLNIKMDENEGLKKRATVAVRDRPIGDWISIGTSLHYQVAGNADTDKYREKRRDVPHYTFNEDWDSIIQSLFDLKGLPVDEALLSNTLFAAVKEEHIEPSTPVVANEDVVVKVDVAKSKKAKASKKEPKPKDENKAIIALAKQKVQEFRNKKWSETTIGTYVVAKINDELKVVKATKAHVNFGSILVLSKSTSKKEKETKSKNTTSKNSIILTIDFSNVLKKDYRKDIVILSNALNLTVESTEGLFSKKDIAVVKVSDESFIKKFSKGVKITKGDSAQKVISNVVKNKVDPELTLYAAEVANKYKKMGWKLENYHIVENNSNNPKSKYLCLRYDKIGNTTSLGKLIDFV